MIQADISRIKHIKWDFDGVFYDYESVQYARETTYALFNVANAKGACDVFKGMTFEEARLIAVESYNKHNDGVQEFVLLGKNYGLTEEETKLGIFQAFHDNMFDLLPKNCPELFEPQQDLIDAFARTKHRFDHSVLTHSCIDRWAKPMAKHMGIENNFGVWLGYNDFNFIPKGKSHEPLKISFDKTGACEEETAFVEDSIKHLEISKNAYPDMVTVFKGNMEWEEKPDYVDIIIKKPVDLLRVLVA